MTVRIAQHPFTDGATDQWSKTLLGPAWVEIFRTHDKRPYYVADANLSAGMDRFITDVISMAPVHMSYGTVYAAFLDGSEVPAGEWHYDLGEYRTDGAFRCVATWASDDWPLQNLFDSKEVGHPPNRYVVAFNEGTDYHRRLPVPARPDAWGVFVSMSLYRDDEPANLDCPRLADLRHRGPRSRQAMLHKPVKRERY